MMPCFADGRRNGGGFGAPRSAIVTELRIERPCHRRQTTSSRSHSRLLIRGEPDRRACHVLRLAGCAHRGSASSVASPLPSSLVSQASRLIGVRIAPGATALTRMVSEATSWARVCTDQPDAALGRRVVETPGPRNQLVNRAHANDVARRSRRPARPLLPACGTAVSPHGSKRKLTGQVDVDDGAPVVERHVRDRGVLLQAGVRDQHIHAAEG